MILVPIYWTDKRLDSRMSVPGPHMPPCKDLLAKLTNFNTLLSTTGKDSHTPPQQT